MARWYSLSPREQQVAALICLNYTSRQIAARLRISPETVKTHTRNLLSKFDLRTRVELRELLADWDFSAWR
jgi:DNA-binding CsgD family transcriptional regulator